MKNNKEVKTIQINKDLHTELKQYCNDNSLKLNLFVEKLISNNIRSLNGSNQTKE